jgi:GT2 family glycosyltransferase
MKIFAILIIYNRRIDEAKTVSSLLKNCAKNPDVFKDFRLIIYDNSPEAQKTEMPLPFEYEYVHIPKHKGLAEAYNYALNKAIEASCGWLLLLDQDSSLPDEFAGNLSQELSRIEKNSNVCAVVPKMRYKNTFFSPSKVLFGGTLRPIDMAHKGVYASQIFAIGSACTIRVSFLQGIGGFNEFYWLDFLDRWLFITINNMGGKVYVTDSIVDHELSVMDYDKFMTEKRYANILKYEIIFMKRYKSKVERYVYYLRLVKRVIYLFFTVNNKRYSLMTLRHLKNVLLASKKDVPNERA